MRTESYDEHLDLALDEALKGTFPASDPISVSACHPQPVRAESNPSQQKDEKRRAVGDR